jgi:cytochrome c-type biogenesis protein CcmE
MTRRKRRLYTVLLGVMALSAATALVLMAFEDSLVFFYSPTEVQAREATPAEVFRLGGLVEDGSVRRLQDGTTVEFRVTDLTHTVAVTYRGVLPDLFREGQGVVAEGSLGPGGVFVARKVLAKHDENYMPPEVAEALKKSGRWRPQAVQGGAQ